MYRLCHIAHKGFDVGHGGGAVLGKELDDGAADDGTMLTLTHKIGKANRLKKKFEFFCRLAPRGKNAYNEHRSKTTRRV